MDQTVYARAKPGKYLTFYCGSEEYGLEILKVREIIGNLSVTKVPKMPDFIRGVIDLRGSVIPVIEIRKKFLMPGGEDTPETCIIVVQACMGALTLKIGVVVDRVSEVVEITPQEIEPPPEFGAGISTDFILGMAKSKGAVKILLDIEKVLTQGCAGMDSAPAAQAQA